MRSLVHPFLQEVGTPGWVEHTPPNVKAAPALASMYRDMKLVHIVRDGRDVASSAVRFKWGPDSTRDGIIWWADTLREADRGARELRPGQSTVFQLEDFVVHRREESYERLLQFLGIDDEPGMRSFFETQMSAKKAHIGRWRLGLSDAQQEEIMDLYLDILEGLHRDEIAGAPGVPVDAAK
jgi:Sulfotransferase family